jgi:hypothetical protein
MTASDSAATEFLNVDLDLRLKDGLDALLGYLEPSTLLLHRTEQEASLELLRESRSLEETLRDWVECVDALPPEAKELWRRCDMRQLNIGIQAGHRPHAAFFASPSALIATIADAQFEIAFTVYAPVKA